MMIKRRKIKSRVYIDANTVHECDVIRVNEKLHAGDKCIY